MVWFLDSSHVSGSHDLDSNAFLALDSAQVSILQQLVKFLAMWSWSEAWPRCDGILSIFKCRLQVWP